MNATLGLVTSAEQLGAPVGRHGHHVEARGRQALRLAGDLHGAAIDLAQQIGHVVGDHVDDVERQRVGGGKAHRRAHGVGGPIGVAPVERGEAADIGDGVVDDLARFGVAGFVGLVLLRLFLFGAAAGQHRAAERNRGRGADIGAGRHGGDRAGIGDIGAGAGGARAARRHKGDDRHRRRQDRADDLAHRRIEAARRVHAQHDDADFVRRCAAQFPHHIVGDGGTDRAVDIEHQSAFGGPRRHSEHRKHHGQKHDHRAQAHHGNLPGPAAPVAQ